MDFVEISQRQKSNGVIEVFPSFIVKRSKDLLVKGKAFYAIWNPELGLWSKNIYDVASMIDYELYEYQKKIPSDYPSRVLTLSDYSTKKWNEFQDYVKSQPDSQVELDDKIIFSNMEVKRGDYASHKLPYPLIAGDMSSYEELASTLYSPEERHKFEWAIGAIVSGDSKWIQKFIVFYGEPGSGKSTIINIISKLFEGYCTVFDGKALGSSLNQFATSSLKNNPLVALQHDGDLSKIDDTPRLNSIIAHEDMIINEKYKAEYVSRINAFLFMGTNKPVRISDAKSGLIRRLIDVHPSGNKVPPERYNQLVARIPFELGAIASHCLEVYKASGPYYYEAYRPLSMIFQTDVFFNFVEWNYETFKSQNYTTLTQAYDMYKQYCTEALVEFKLPRHKFREELKNYFRIFEEVGTNDEGKRIRSLYKDFISEKFNIIDQQRKGGNSEYVIQLSEIDSLIDAELCLRPAQYANKRGTPAKNWDEVETLLQDLDTHKLHYVRPPENHIVIDFDCRDESGEKSLELNIKEASKWPKTYAELSQGGNGIHLHYIYDGDASQLSYVYAIGIEIKVFSGKSSLRRRLTKCNNLPIAHISTGLPLKEDRRVFNSEFIATEQTIRKMIEKNLMKEYHAFTKPSIDYIYKILDDAYNSGVHYDVTDLRQKVLTFAANSTNNAKYCVSMVAKMQFKSKDIDEIPETIKGEYKNDSIVFFDIEAFPNLFIVCWKYQGEDCEVVRMINPSPQDIEGLFAYKLVGFNNRRYDNHILYARYLGYSNEELFRLSKRIIIEKDRNAFFSDAYGLSYTDIFDFCSKKQSLKKWELELKIHHQECPYPWDQPVPEDKWDEIVDYCVNDVVSTEATFNANKNDFTARKILAKLSGLTENDTTNQHTLKIIFGNERHPQSQFNYVDLSKPIRNISNEMHEYLYKYTCLPVPKPNYPWGPQYWFEPGVSILPYFEGYKFENGHSLYRGEDPKEGGYVYANPGMYWNVAVLDVESMHPSSLEDMYHFGPYTENFSQIKQARIAIKHEDREAIVNFLAGKLMEFINWDDPSSFESVSYALKIAINSVYGLTSASFENAAKDPRNIDNIVAKRGALFMIDLKHAVIEQGFQVVHIKTDSIKIPEANERIIQFVKDFGKKYGYNFEHECTYERMCLINDAVYIAKYDEFGIRNKHGKHAGEWTATGARFAHPYIFKTLFSKEPIEFYDLCEARSVSDANMYICNGDDLSEKIFIGRTGLVCPMQKPYGGTLLRIGQDGKVSAVTATNGYRWMDSESVEILNLKDHIDMGYFRGLVDDALSHIAKYGDPEVFMDEAYSPPWWNCDGNCDTCQYKEANLCDGLPF